MAHIPELPNDIIDHITTLAKKLEFQPVIDQLKEFQFLHKNGVGVSDYFKPYDNDILKQKINHIHEQCVLCDAPTYGRMASGRYCDHCQNYFCLDCIRNNDDYDLYHEDDWLFPFEDPSDPYMFCSCDCYEGYFN